MSRQKHKNKNASKQLALLQDTPKAEAEPTIMGFKPTIVVRSEVYEKVMYWVRASELEVSGMGKVIYHPATQVFEVVEAYLLDQEVGAAHTDIDAAAMGKLMYESHKEPGKLAWWWHSHVNMQAFWSGTDTQTIRTFGQQGWCVATVFNKRSESRSAVCYRVESPTFGVESILLDDVKASVAQKQDERFAVWQAELNTKVREKVYTPQSFVPDKEYIPSWRKHLEDKDASPLATGYERKQATALTRGVSVPPKTEDTRDEWGLTREERIEVYQEGLTGMGVHAEARFKNMQPLDYYNFIQSCGREEYNLLEEELMNALYAGEL